MAELNQKATAAALGHLKANNPHLTPQQYKTLRGQILAGDPAGAMKGLRAILLLEVNAVKKITKQGGAETNA